MNRGIPVPAATLLLAAMATACRHSAQPGVLAATIALIHRNDSLHTVLDGLDTAAITHMHALFLSERPAIEQRFRDTLTPQEAEILGNYHRAMAVTLPRVMADHRRTGGQMDSARRRLGDLRHDLEQGLLDNTEQRQALRAERAWDSTLADNVEHLQADIGQLEKDRRKYRSAIDPLLRP